MKYLINILLNQNLFFSLDENIVGQNHLNKNSFFDDLKDENDDFEFNQDIDMDENIRSPGWIRYQKRIK